MSYARKSNDIDKGFPIAWAIFVITALVLFIMIAIELRFGMSIKRLIPFRSELGKLPKYLLDGLIVLTIYIVQLAYYVRNGRWKAILRNYDSLPLYAKGSADWLTGALLALTLGWVLFETFAAVGGR